MDAEMKRFIANTSVGASALRRMVAQGGVAIARKYLAGIDLEKLDPKTFQAALNRHTTQLAKKLRPARRGNSTWGPARKVLNLYFRGATYNAYLRSRYHLDRIEKLLEIPLDSYSARHIREDCETYKIACNIPPWNGVVGVTRESNADYQTAANCVAEHKGFSARVHLDIFYWRN